MKLIGEIEKNSREMIKAQVGEYKNRPIVDLKVWVVDKEGKEIATKKGLTISTELLGDFSYLVEQVSKYLEEHKEEVAKGVDHPG